MPNRSTEKLPRRIFTYYLLFCLVSLVSLAVGITFVSHNSLIAARENECLSLVSKAESKFSMAQLRSGDADFQELAKQLVDQQSLLYCAIVSPAGDYITHSTPDLVGSLHHAPLGERKQFGEIEEVRYELDAGVRVREFSVPLSNPNQRIGTLQMAFVDASRWHHSLRVAQDFPLALIGPAILMCIGGSVLRRMVLPVAQVQSQLTRFAVAPSLQETAFQRVAVQDSMTVGWNCLVDELNETIHKEDLNARLSGALQSRQQGRSHELLDSLPDGIAETDDTGQITFVNNAMAALLGGNTKEEFLGETIEKCLNKDVMGEAIAPLSDDASRARPSIKEIKKETPFGERILRVARHPIHSSGRDMRAGQVWSVRDVTQQKLADKVRDEFLDSATHELRTPLANIKAYAETLAISEVLEVEQQKEFCNIINSEATRLARLIDDMLNVSSIEAGALRVTMQKVELARLLQDVIQKVRPLMDKKQITFATLFSEKLPELPLDKDKFSICLINLLGNAAKYTQPGGRVAFKARVASKQLIIEVEDTGVGIAADELPKVFKKFFRSADERVQAESGTGLGLAFAQEVVRLHGGSLTVESQIDNGSTFTITLPMSNGATSRGTEHV